MIKKHLKKDQAIDKITSKTKAGIAKDLKPESMVTEAPAVLNEFTRIVNNRIEYLRALGVSNDTNIQEALGMFSDEKLQMLKEALNTKSGVLPETKLQQLGFIFVDDLGMMETCENFIAHKRVDMLNAFVDAYGREFIAE